jgi:hypothetical protein
MLMISRLKFPIQPLVKEMLDQLPADVWTSSTTTFLDPAMGGGQFLVEIQTRLRAAGHSDENIANRMYGCEINKLRVNYTKNNKKLVTNNLFISDFLSYDWGNMKFDVIVGNPPYQSPKKGDSSYWARFVMNASSMLKPNGWNAMVIPCGWMSPTNDVRRGRQSVLRDVFAKMNTTSISIDTKMGAQYFPGVGQRFSYYVVQNAAHKGMTTIDTGAGKVVTDLRDLPMLPREPSDITLGILTKLCKGKEKWDFLRVNRCDYSDVVLDKPTSTHKHLRLNGNTNHLDTQVYSKTPCEYQNTRKVVLPYNGTQYKFVVDNGNFGVTNCYLMTLAKNDLIASAKLYFESPLVSWLGKNKFTQYNEAALIECVHKMDLSEKITINDVWQHYGLTQSEIDYIMSGV